MGWIEEHLRTEEVLIYKTRLHWSLFLLPVLFFAAGLFNTLFIYAGFLALLYNLYRFYSHEYVLTDRRIIYKKGLFYIRINEMSLDRVENVLCTQTVADRIFGSGSVIILGSGISTLKSRGLNQPNVFRNAIYSQLSI